MTHGTATGYAYHGCRCAACCAANTARVREYRKRQTTSEAPVTTSGIHAERPGDACDVPGPAPNTGGSMQARLYPGAQFGRLTVLEVKRPKALCECECGVTKEYFVTNLYNGRTKSCGCLMAELASERFKGVAPPSKTHGHGSPSNPSPTYRTWCSMRQRTGNPNATGWKYYGGRGITVCDRWRDSFENFLADMGERPNGMTLDRIDPDGNYEPGNCRWATSAEQQANRRCSR